MTIQSVSPTTHSDPSASAAKRKTSLDQQDFLNLLITQLKNQNPLNPMDHYQMATQVVQFNSLESLHRIHQSIDLLGAYQSSMNALQAAGLIGKRVEIESQSLSIHGGKVSEGYYQLSKPGKVKIEIYNDQGELIRTLEKGGKDGAKQTFIWDGNSQSGIKQPDGKYAFRVSAVDEKGNAVTVSHSRIDTVKGIHFEKGVIYLDLGSESIPLKDVKAILNSSV